MHRNAIDCEVLTGTERNKKILIPRTILSFNFQRSQFPIIAAFAMTINKSQKQTFEKIAILLRQPVFYCTSQQVAFDHHSMV
jgi:ATP-dependent exoDNAse (exonuclease V) alpha subunit